MVDGIYIIKYLSKISVSLASFNINIIVINMLSFFSKLLMTQVHAKSTKAMNMKNQQLKHSSTSISNFVPVSLVSFGGKLWVLIVYASTMPS